MVEHQHYVTIMYFIKNMLGFTARATYYNHLDEPGWPQRVYPTGTKKPMLVYSECLAYLRQLEAKRAAPPPVPEPAKKRRPGRPVSRPTPGQRADP
jgi:hypothetical protein